MCETVRCLSDVYRSELCVKQFGVFVMYIGVSFCVKHCGIIYCAYQCELCVKQKDVSALFLLKCAVVYGIVEFPGNEKSFN